MSKFIIALFIASVLAQTPQPPLWPNTFWQTFNETKITQTGNQYDTGTYYYGYSTLNYRLDRTNGRYDAFCGNGGPYANINYACNTYVVNGNRFLHLPQQNFCCFCCSAANGCGVLKPTWMSDSTYIDTEVNNGQQCYKWKKAGAAGDDYLYETVGSVPVNRVTVSIHDSPFDIFEFGPRSSTLPAGIFNLPSICTVNTPCNWGFCQQTRASTKVSE
jgi:hypothetical protein